MRFQAITLALSLAVVQATADAGLIAAQIRSNGDLFKRQTFYCSNVPASTPDDEVCPLSCGAGYIECVSWQNCYNPGAGDTCCYDGSYCPSGQYCAADSSGSVVCCNNGQSLADCGAVNTVSTVAPSSPSVYTAASSAASSASVSSSSAFSAPASSSSSYSATTSSTASEYTAYTYTPSTTAESTPYLSSVASVVESYASSVTSNFGGQATTTVGQLTSAAATTANLPAQQTTNASGRLGEGAVSSLLTVLSLLIFWM